MLTTREIINIAVQNKGNCIQVERIVCQNWVSTYFIYLKKRFKNGKISLIVDNHCKERMWTNYEFLETYENDVWQVIYGNL